ncbi:MAG: putative Fe-S cluster assembly protein SufT [Chthoniobacteraceae bacterium]
MSAPGYTEVTFNRDCEAIQIPSGEKMQMTKGTTVVITQSLGGSYTIATDRGLARITEANADALGLEAVEKPAAPVDASVAVDEKAVWDQLKTCYDPEIPVNIVDLGLVYDCTITPQPEVGAKVNVKMTLTAPGCGMGPTICAEAKSKIITIPGVADADVDLVWDPPWNQEMISEVGKMQLGLI